MGSKQCYGYHLSQNVLFKPICEITLLITNGNLSGHTTGKNFCEPVIKWSDKLHLQGKTAIPQAL